MWAYVVHILTRSPRYKDKDIHGVTQPRVLSLAPFQIAHDDASLASRTLFYRVPLIKVITSICSDLSGVLNEMISISHREELLDVLDVHIHEKPAAGGWSSRSRTWPQGTRQV